MGMGRLHAGYCRTVGSSVGAPVIVTGLFRKTEVVGGVVTNGSAVSTRSLGRLGRAFRLFDFRVLNLGRRTKTSSDHRTTCKGIISVLLRRHMGTGTGGS